MRTHRRPDPPGTPLAGADPAIDAGGRRGGTPDLDLLIDRFLAHQRARGLSAYTLANYRATFANLRRYCGEEGLAPGPADLTTDFFRRYQGWLLALPLAAPRRGSSRRQASAVAARMRQIRAFCAWLVDEGELERPVRIALPKTPHRRVEVLSDGQVRAVLASRHLAGGSALAKRNRALFSLLLDSGLRLAEIAGVEDRDLFLASGWVRVVGKGNRERLAPFSETTRAAIAAWLAARDAEPIAVAGGGRGKTFELAREGVVALVERVGRDVGVPLRTHLFRHTSATTMVARGMDVATLQRILGHSSIAVTQVYLHLNQDQLKAKHAASSPMDYFGPAPPPARRRSLGGPPTPGCGDEPADRG